MAKFKPPQKQRSFFSGAAPSARQIEAQALRQLSKVYIFSDSWDLEAFSQLGNQ